MASNLIEYSNDILQANKRDLEEATKEGEYLGNIFLIYNLMILGLKSSLLGRLGLSEKKLKILSTGLQQIAEKADVLGSFKLSLIHLLIYS
jgi:gamma-glutamyl phosphate reductase